MNDWSEAGNAIYTRIIDAVDERRRAGVDPTSIAVHPATYNDLRRDLPHFMFSVAALSWEIRVDGLLLIADQTIPIGEIKAK